MGLTPGQKKYKEYLNSNEWKQLKERKSKKRQGAKKCIACNSRADLNLHHMLYRKNWNDTEPYDTCWLCKRCHGVFHKKFGLQIDKPFNRNRQWLKAKTKWGIRNELKRIGEWPPN